MVSTMAANGVDAMRERASSVEANSHEPPIARADATADAAVLASRSVRRPARRAGRPLMLVAQGGVLALGVLIWWGVSSQIPADGVPSPVETVRALAGVIATAVFWGALWETVQTFLLGILICIVVGVPLGLAIGRSRIATQSTRLSFDFLRTIPPIAILPLVLLLYGPTPTMVLVMVVLGAIWPIVIQSVYAANQTEPQLDDMASAFQIKGWRRLVRIFLPGVLPFVLTGLRVGTTICLLLTITGELLGGAPGIGSAIITAQQNLNNPQMYAYVVVAALLGLVVNAGFWAAQRRMLHWHPSFRGEDAK
jgi:ABC-type nitrate/sulfonate/bicarbonate transport system permease component